MKKKLAIIAGTLAMSIGLVLGGTGAAFASSSPHIGPGVPGTPSCVGQSTAFIAQEGSNVGINPGIGNLASFVGESVQQIQQFVDAYCASTL